MLAKPPSWASPTPGSSLTPPPTSTSEDSEPWTPPEPKRQGSNGGGNAAPRARQSRKGKNGVDKSALFWVHMDSRSVSNGPREDTLKRIRSHVMSEHNRKKRLENDKRYKTKPWKHLAFQPVETTTTASGDVGPATISPFSPAPSATPAPSMVQDDEELVVSPTTTSAEGEVVPQSSPWSYLGTGANDPFYTTHTHLSDRMMRHLRHCKFAVLLEGR